MHFLAIYLTYLAESLLCLASILINKRALVNTSICEVKAALGRLITECDKAR